MPKPDHPYSDLPRSAFWRSAVAEAGLWGLSHLWASKWRLPADARFATYGSCFAQHISRSLVRRGLNWIDAEPAPFRTPDSLAREYGYGLFSARTGNIYRAAQLLACSMRPGIEPGGFASPDDLMASRASTGRAFRRAAEKADVLVFTLGLTEGWEDDQTGQCFPLCPGTGAGRFDPGRHRFVNDRAADVADGLTRAFARLWSINPELRILLTVSPVPLTATASGNHVLPATVWSKSVLRAAAGELAADDPRIDYFPSYEIVAGLQSRSALFEPNLRTVAPQGVDLVMHHFFAGIDLSDPARPGSAAPDPTVELEAAMMAEDLVCEELSLEGFNRG
jgi:GSCFA family